MTDSKEEPRTLVRVRARQPRGRYRCGKFWPASPVEAQVTAEQLAALESDPVLVVHRAERRNADVPAVSEVQPGAKEPPKPEPFGDVRLERQRKELAELDKQRAAEEESERKAQAAADLADYESKPNDSKKSRRNR